jgi:hypothetical protein
MLRGSIRSLPLPFTLHLNRYVPGTFTAQAAPAAGVGVSAVNSGL